MIELKPSVILNTLLFTYDWTEACEKPVVAMILLDNCLFDSLHGLTIKNRKILIN